MSAKWTEGLDHHTFVNPRGLQDENDLRDKCRKMIADELNFNKKVGDYRIGVPRSGMLTIINCNDLMSADIFVHMLRQDLTVQAEGMNSSAFDQAQMTIKGDLFLKSLDEDLADA